MTTTTPRLGQRVRFMAPHDRVSDSAWFFWTTFAKWEPTGEPNVELSAEYKAARTFSAPEARRIKGRR